MELAESMRDSGVLHPPVVMSIPYPESWTSEDSREHDYKLLAGGRRMAALTLLNFNKVEGANGEDWQMIPVTVFDELSADKRVIIEVEENLIRKEMTWQETLAGIVAYHKAKSREAILEGDNWTQTMTGKLLNMPQSEISHAFKVYKLIQAGDKDIIAAENLFNAIKIIYGRELDAGQAEQMRRITLKRAEQSARASGQANGDTGSLSEGATSLIGSGSRGNLPLLSSNITANVPEVGQIQGVGRIQFTPSDVAAFYHHGNALEVLPLLAKNTLINHIVCDPPYGINMANLTSDSIERIADTHVVEDNLKLLPQFLDVAFHAIAEDGFLCMFYDLDHHEKIAKWGAAIGWRVCRWPLVWCKTSQCSNQAAHVNITKATEVCYFFRRSEKSILKTKQNKNWLLEGSVSTSTHPFPKPFAVWKYCIESVSTEGQTIVDPFAGEGSSLAAFFKTGRIPVGIEIDEKHIASGLSYVAEQINNRSILDDIMSPPL
jgi:DNA modification methylase/ParB-like chromosome segregation protein Spo0J